MKTIEEQVQDLVNIKIQRDSFQRYGSSTRPDRLVSMSDAEFFMEILIERDRISREEERERIFQEIEQELSNRAKHSNGVELLFADGMTTAQTIVLNNPLEDKKGL